MMPLPPGPRLLASVRDVAEARIAAALGADIVDLKEPVAGALGAVPAVEQRSIVLALGRPRPLLSATVGDLPLCATDELVAALHATADNGVDIVKFGVFARGGDATAGLAALDARLRRDSVRVALVAVLLADQLSDAAQAAALAAQALAVHGVAGIMLDTAAKTGVDAGARRLPEIFDAAALQRFVATVHAAGGYAGLAGALRVDDIASMAATGADLLGFRSALCAGARTGTLDAAAFSRVRVQVAAASALRSAPALPSNTNVVATRGKSAASSG